MAIITIKIVETIMMDTETNQIISSTRTVENSEGVAAPNKKQAKRVIIEEDNEDPKIKLVDNKLVFNLNAVKLINAKVGDRICISYKQLKDGTFIPIMGIQENMGDSVSGNKLTKSLTVSYKGKQAESLAMYGSEFNLELLDNNIVSLKDPNNEGLIDILDDELSDIPEIKEEEVVIKEVNNSSDENLDNSLDNITFDFNF